jgi:hypothetical protein
MGSLLSRNIGRGLTLTCSRKGTGYSAFRSSFTMKFCKRRSFWDGRNDVKQHKVFFLRRLSTTSGFAHHCIKPNTAVALWWFKCNSPLVLLVGGGEF